MKTKITIIIDSERNVFSAKSNLPMDDIKLASTVLAASVQIFAEAAGISVPKAYEWMITKAPKLDFDSETAKEC